MPQTGQAGTVEGSGTGGQCNRWRLQWHRITVQSDRHSRPSTTGGILQPSRNAPEPLPADAPLGRSLGELARGDSRWTVFLETRPHPRGTGLRHNTLQGRLHFVDQAEVHRSTGWIFSEWTDADVVNRFNEFSAAELWLLLDSLA